MSSLPHPVKLLVGTLSLMLTLSGWASWPATDQRALLPSTTQTALRVGGLTDPYRAAELASRVAAGDGIVACTLNPRTQIAVVTHNPAHVSTADLRRMLADGGAYVVVPAPTPAAITTY